MYRNFRLAVMGDNMMLYVTLMYISILLRAILVRLFSHASRLLFIRLAAFLLIQLLVLALPVEAALVWQALEALVYWVLVMYH